MAGTTTSSRRTQVAHSDMNDLLIQFNAAIVDIEALRAAVDAIADKLDADGGVTDTDYATTAAVATAATMTAAKIGDLSGTAISS